MQVQNIELDRDEAIRMYRKYKEHRHWDSPVDQEIERIYKAISKGQIVIRALESIRLAGLGEDGLPKLAIARADAETCFLETMSNGGARMSCVKWINGTTSRSRYVDFEAGTFMFPPRRDRASDFRAMVPHVPPDIRPRRGIANYHILWEAVWTREVPRDPMLLRRIGGGDMWLVLGAWDLTDIERGVLADRLTARARQ